MLETRDDQSIAGVGLKEQLLSLPWQLPELQIITARN